MRIYIYFFLDFYNQKKYKMFIFFYKKIKICKYIEHRRRRAQ